jgi:hypothetical protein
MRSKAKTTRLDPELDRQLTEAEKQGEAIEAVFTLEENGSVPDPESVDRLLEQALKRAEGATGEKAEDLNVFRYMASFAVRAEPQLIRELLEQPEVSAGVANRQPGTNGSQADDPGAAE